MGFLNTIQENILELIFPIECLGCGAAHFELCPDCISKCALAERPTSPWIYPIFDYRDPIIKKSIGLIKYKRKKRILAVFADILYERIIEELSELSLMENFRAPILIPIPLSRIRLRERGFNQTQLLAKKISEVDLGKNMVLKNNVLKKPKETEHQARIKNRTLRLKNLIGTFKVSEPSTIVGRNIILIDDVTTTGATLNEARKVLKASGAKKVIAFTIAH